MRIAVADFQHETNTVAPTVADCEAFRVAKAFPPLVRGREMLAVIRGKKLPTAGAISILEAAGAELVPILWCLATPSAHVTEDAYERVAGEIVQGIAASAPLDGILFELHSAMVARHVDDGEGELLARVRRVVGSGVPISVPLDLHANVTPEMVDKAEYLDLYRYYPHIDMAEAARNDPQRQAPGQSVPAARLSHPGEWRLHRLRPRTRDLSSDHACVGARAGTCRIVVWRRLPSC